eukprot:3484166-Pyramimonas_sp.AAC.1
MWGHETCEGYTEIGPRPSVEPSWVVQTLARGIRWSAFVWGRETCERCAKIARKPSVDPLVGSRNVS